MNKTNYKQLKQYKSMKNSGSIVGQAIKFKRVKTYNPNGGSKVETFGLVIDYLFGKYFSVIFAHEDGEYGECLVSCRDMEICNDDEQPQAVKNALFWATQTINNIMERIKLFDDKKDVQSVNNLIYKNRIANIILLEYGSNNH